HLGSFLKRRPRELSGGQRQRVAIGRAITRKPSLFLLDEPLSNLDAALRVNMRVELARLKGELNSTMIYVTHDQVEAMTLADRIVVMNAGRIEQVGAPLELYEQPCNRFVAGFLGSPAMNFLKGTVTEVSAGVAQVDLAAGAMIAVPLERGVPAGSAVELGIRPEHVRLNDDGEGPEISGRAGVVEMLGSDTFVHVQKGEETIVVRDSQARRLKAGADVRLTLPLRACHLFDPGGQRISRLPGMAEAA
ncbi:MAG: ABC transporter ATP-binding protein, partial [Tropicimonas sp.]|uniref:ABC transporter ATP-binding protein n=1 Tax=Tropicimonas sp. TaxID=2067044 RepID=UPI003A893CF0